MPGTWYLVPGTWYLVPGEAPRLALAHDLWIWVLWLKLDVAGWDCQARWARARLVRYRRSGKLAVRRAASR
jgi:hypothetical protein